MPFDDVGFLANQSPAFGAMALVVGRRPSTCATQQTYVHDTVLCQVTGLYAVRLWPMAVDALPNFLTHLTA